SQLLTFQKKYDEGMALTEKALVESLALNDSSFIAHFYYQRGYYNEVLGNIESTKRDYTVAYTLFRAFHLKTYEKIVLNGKKDFLLFTF
ncbi:MAG: hypothetical protein WBV68_05915, partial [Exiguobacterium oxidotolerans]